MAPKIMAGQESRNPIFIKRSQRNLNSIDAGSNSKKGLNFQKEENPEFLQSQEIIKNSKNYRSRPNNIFSIV